MRRFTTRELTQSRLKELLHYDPETGDFTRLVTDRSVKKGDIAGYVNPKGYRIIRVAGTSYKSGRLAFLYMKGYFPEHQVDHKYRDKDNNAWSDIRHTSPSCNSKNRGVREDNKTGVTGVGFHKRIGKLYAAINVDGRNKHLGYFNSMIDAVMARWEAEKKYKYTDCQTSSTAYFYLKNEGLI